MFCHVYMQYPSFKTFIITVNALERLFTPMITMHIPKPSYCNVCSVDEYSQKNLLAPIGFVKIKLII